MSPSTVRICLVLLGVLGCGGAPFTADTDPAVLDGGTEVPIESGAGALDRRVMSQEAEAWEVGSGHADTGTRDAQVGAQTDAASARCLSWTLGGIGMPDGTVATASNTYSTFVPADVIDGDVSTYWNAGSDTASLTLRFPAPQFLTGIRMAGSATPPAIETYAVTPVGGSSSIGSATYSVGALPYSVGQAIPVTPGTYEAITIDVSGNSSWVAINEISLLTTSCPGGG